MLWPKSTTKDYIRAEHKLHSISKIFISQVIIPKVAFFLLFFSLLYSAGTQHGNLHPAGWPILFCRPTQEPVLATANTGKHRERFRTTQTNREGGTDRTSPKRIRTSRQTDGQACWQTERRQTDGNYVGGRCQSNAVQWDFLFYRGTTSQARSIGLIAVTSCDDSLRGLTPLDISDS